MILDVVPDWPAGVHIVCAQSNGDKYKKILEPLLKQRTDISVHKIAVGKTNSLRDVLPDGSADPRDTLDVFQKNYDLWKWFTKVFPPPRLSHKDARQGPGFGAIVQLAAGHIRMFTYAGATDVANQVYNM